MSTLIVEVSQVDAIESHPNADRLEIVTVKGWKVCAKKGELQVGQKVVYFPPDAVLPPELANGPTDQPAGRLGVAKYLKGLPKRDDGTRAPGGRVCAARLRGYPSFGLIMPLDPTFGDEDWAIGTDVADHFGVVKFEPPEQKSEGDSAPDHIRFFKYSSPEHFANYPHVIAEGEEVIITEKIHGKNCRLGLILDTKEDGSESWEWMAGSHDVNRLQYSNSTKRFKASDLIEKQIVRDEDLAEGLIFSTDGERYWEVQEVRRKDTGVFLYTERVTKEGRPLLKESDYWKPMSESVRSLLSYLRDDYTCSEPKNSIIMYGEIFGSGVQDMAYGFSQGRTDFAAFDVSINGQYLGWHELVSLCDRFGVSTVTPLFCGPFTPSLIEEHTSGETTVCDPGQAGKFKGREGIVIKPTVERLDTETMLFTSTNGRVILKSVSVDYLSRKGGTEYH